MDTPNSRFELIHKFPIDILAGIVLFVPGEDIGRLKMTGCKSLWSNLMCRNVVKSVKLGNGGLRFKSWPSFMNEFPSLESLRIKNHRLQWWSDLKLTLNQLPSTLRNLSLVIRDSDLSCDCFFEIPTQADTIRIDEHLPHLEALEILGKMWTNFDWVSHCPPTLTSLNVLHWKSDIDLPSSLLHFQTVQGTPTVLPLAMELLSCDHYSYSLPCLTSLSARIGSGDWVQLEHIVSLPQSLTNLEVKDSNLPSSTWSSLPANLKSLSFEISDKNCTVMVRKVNPISGEVDEVETCPLELLPRSLTKISITGICEWACGGCSSLFPPQLKTFDAPFLTLEPNAAKQLPASLEHFSTFYFYEELSEHLPEGLKSLSFSNALLSPKMIQSLPRSLTKLSSTLDREWINHTTGKLPESAPFDYPSCLACLPPKLISLKLYGFVDLQDDFIHNENFSNLLSLTLRETDQLSDNFIPFLNRHLICLDVDSSPNLTGKCFKSLPKSLTSLSLGSSSSIVDEDVQHLPRTMKTIRIPYATELSDACIRDFPRTCKRIDLTHNAQITELCIPDLPISLQIIVLADWCWNYVVYPYERS